MVKPVIYGIEKASVSVPLYGLKIPKHHFVRLFQEQKGQWPARRVSTPELVDQYGHLPIQIDGVPEPNQYSSNGKKIVLGPRYFRNSDRHIGVRILGNIRHRDAGREFGYEIIPLPFGIPFSRVEEIKCLYNARRFANQENGGGNPLLESVGSDLLTLVRFFNGEFAEWEGEDLSYNAGPPVEKLVTMLREVGFEEGPQ